MRQFAAILAAIHANGWRSRSETATVFDERSFFESLRLEPYYAFTATVAPPAAAFLQALIAETLATRVTVVHGDFSPKNVLIHDGNLILLDHEVIHFGDPAFDLGFSLAHFLSKAHHLPAHRDAFARAASAYWAAYLDGVSNTAVADRLEPRAVRHTLGCLLARVAGRSPLEYLTPAEQGRQRDTVCRLMGAPPGSIAELLHLFTESL
jgi:aminoglycoside phosphotransferase (APT) family kinase protein